MPNGLVATSVGSAAWLGSGAYGSTTGGPVGNLLVPALSCDPLKGLKQVKTEAGSQSMRFNPACFTVPAYGTMGQEIMPYMRQPNYWDSDLGIYKNFHITESQYIQFRASATNWLNHPLGQFGLANMSDISLNFQQQTAATCTGCSGLTVTSSAASNQNATTNGAPAFKTGSRFVTLALKYYF